MLTVKRVAAQVLHFCIICQAESNVCIIRETESSKVLELIAACSTYRTSLQQALVTLCHAQKFSVAWLPLCSRRMSAWHRNQCRTTTR